LPTISHIYHLSLHDALPISKFLSFVGALISTGSRGIIRDMLKNKMFDCVITTCGALDHDIARTYGKYYAGDFRMDDSILLKQKIDRKSTRLNSSHEWISYAV